MVVFRLPHGRRSAFRFPGSRPGSGFRRVYDATGPTVPTSPTRWRAHTGHRTPGAGRLLGQGHETRHSTQHPAPADRHADRLDATRHNAVLQRTPHTSADNHTTPLGSASHTRPAPPDTTSRPGPRRKPPLVMSAHRTSHQPPATRALCCVRPRPGGFQTRPDLL